MSIKPISDLRRRMIEDISVRNFGEKSLTELRARLGEKGYLEGGSEEELVEA